MKTCPICGKNAVRVIYYGLPSYLCEDRECACHFGWSADLTHWLPFNGYLMVYSGSYWKALWHWLFSDVSEGEE